MMFILMMFILMMFILMMFIHLKTEESMSLKHNISKYDFELWKIYK
jgi:hypothetical protein